MAILSSSYGLDCHVRAEDGTMNALLRYFRHISLLVRVTHLCRFTELQVE